MHFMIKRKQMELKFALNKAWSLTDSAWGLLNASWSSCGTAWEGVCYLHKWQRLEGRPRSVDSRLQIREEPWDTKSVVNLQSSKVLSLWLWREGQDLQARNWQKWYLYSYWFKVLMHTGACKMITGGMKAAIGKKQAVTRKYLHYMR